MFHFGENAVWQILMVLVVLCGLILLNEFARRTKFGGLFMFGVVPGVLTIYFIVIAIGAGTGAEWALKNQTYLYKREQKAFHTFFQLGLFHCLPGKIYDQADQLSADYINNYCK